jgi:hypothetical protein
VSGRCYTIALPDGTQAIVRTGKRGWKPTAADLKAIAEMRECLLRERLRSHADPECLHENDGEGTCLGCGAQMVQLK